MGFNRLARLRQKWKEFPQVINDAPHMLRELRHFMRAAPRRAFPVQLPADARDVAIGRKSLLVLPLQQSTCREADDKETFRFSCTSCGSCCRSLANQVWLDPHDLWRMRHQRNRGVFRNLMGQFEVAALPSSADSSPQVISVASNWKVAVKQREGVAPVMFLRTVSFEGDNRCAFAQPIVSSSSSSSGSSKSRLSCSLGPSAMPYSCSLYPLSHFFTSPNQLFFSLDVTKCEGTKMPTSLSSVSSSPFDTKVDSAANSSSIPRTRTLTEYSRSNDLEERREAAEWFRRLATAHACGGFDSLLHSSISQFAAHTDSKTNSEDVRTPSSLLSVVPSWLVEAFEQGGLTPDAAVLSLHQQLRRVWYQDCSSFKAWKDAKRKIEEDTLCTHEEVLALAEALLSWRATEKKNKKHSRQSKTHD